MVSLILYDRKRLFGLINILPTIFQVVTDNKPIKDNPTMDSGSKFRGNTEVSVFLYLVILDSSMLKFHRIKVIIKVNISMSLFKKKKSMMVFVWQTKPKVVAVRNEHIQIFCGSCGGNYNKDEFWIGCDICEWWYHGKCIMMTPTKAETLKHYKCASCSLRRGRL